MLKRLLIPMLILFLWSCQPEWIKHAPKYDYQGLTKHERKVHRAAEHFLYEAIRTGIPLEVHPATRIDSLKLNEQVGTLVLYFNKFFARQPFREENVTAIYRSIRKDLGKRYRNYKIELRTIGYPIQDLIPNYYRSNPQTRDLKRMPKSILRPLPLVRQVGKLQPAAGLYGNNIALWNSHGWYYDHKKNRWEWQRPRLFQTVEDLLPTGFVLQYLMPMLENAGALVFDPRERDWQSHMVVVDNDMAADSLPVYLESANWKTAPGTGFALDQPPYTNENPFALGTARQIQADSTASDSIRWAPQIPKSGRYAVYISYQQTDSSVTDALYTVRDAGGSTKFLVNQTLSGGTWVYLGTFLFKRGFHPDSGAVLLSSKSNTPGKIISADAVRFGGGKGLIQRAGRESGRPRFVEGARYNLQFSGIPDTLVWNLNGGSNDYNDDYQSRGEWVNYLKGAPYGPNKNRQLPGLGLPIDLSLAFHTDAGITANDTAVGTLAIYSLTGADTLSTFPDSVSRLACRDLADLVQSQLVDDIRQQLDPVWQRRSLLNARYSETFRPNVPAMILELLSHQNFRDMKLALDPEFRFVVARAIYKAMLRFIATQENRDYVVQPLPVTHFSAVFDTSDRVVLRWRPQEDPLEPTAVPDAYRVFMRREDGGFDDGQLVENDSLILDLPEAGVVYSFKVQAVNAGGASMDSEILSLCRVQNDKPVVLVVNGFTRVGAPAQFRQEDMSGFFNLQDEGVPDGYDLSFTGQQVDFMTGSKFRINDAPGHGASYADYETQVIAGNTFDFPFIHGRAIRDAGYSFVSCSRQSLVDGLVQIDSYPLIDLILGEQRREPWLDSLRAERYAAFPTALQRVLKNYSASGGRLLISGAHVASDLYSGRPAKHPDARFASEVLGIKWMTDHASRRGEVFAVNDSLFSVGPFSFNTQFTDSIYKVESPDALGPVGSGKVILRYRENEFSAAVFTKRPNRCLIMGFPLETITMPFARNAVMRAALQLLLEP